MTGLLALEEKIEMNSRLLRQFRSTLSDKFRTVLLFHRRRNIPVPIIGARKPLLQLLSVFI